MQGDRLGLIFTCCHPSLDRAAQVALTLRLLGGLSTPEIARGVLGVRVDDPLGTLPKLFLRFRVTG